MKFKISNDELSTLNGATSTSFPKYTSQLINWANQNAQGTRPKVVGQLSELFPEFEQEHDNPSIESWNEWYSERYPNAISTATEKKYLQIENLKEAIQLIDKDMIRRWVEDLVVTKTFNGLFVQKAILAKLAELKGERYRLATPDEESKGIDGYIGSEAYSVKPDSYKTMNRLSETIRVRFVYYTKSKTGLTIEVEE